MGKTNNKGRNTREEYTNIMGDRITRREGENEMTRIESMEMEMEKMEMETTD